MATAPSTVISIEEYLHTIYHPDREYVDGEVEERHLGELDHGTLQAELAFWFRSHQQEWNIRVVTELRTRVASTRVRIPDVCLLALDGPRDPVTIVPPLVCIEILSPEDRWSRVSKVMEDYLVMGVEHLWIIDPMERLAYTYTREGRLKVVGTRLELPGSPIYVDLPTLFLPLD